MAIKRIGEPFETVLTRDGEFKYRERLVYDKHIDGPVVLHKIRELDADLERVWAVCFYATGRLSSSDWVYRYDMLRNTPREEVEERAKVLMDLITAGEREGE